MPEISDSTARESYTIAGKTFSIPMPFGAGHVLTDGEASQLNQVFAENVRNNLAAKIKEHTEAGTFDQDVMQGSVDDYCATYEFGVRTGGGRTGDPVVAEAMNIAREMVREAIKKQGKYKLSDITAKQISDLAKSTIEKNPKIMETARARVEEVRQIAGIELDSLDLSSEKPAETTGAGEEAAPPKAGRKAAPTSAE